MGTVMNGNGIYMAYTDCLRSDALFDRLYGSLPEERRKKIDSIRHAEGRRQSLGAAALLGKALSANGIDLNGVTVCTDANGKPYIKGNPVFFNLSHSANAVMCAVSDKPIGCDAEKLGHADIRLAKRFFHPDEYADILLKNDDLTFFRYWTLKESVVKLSGRGLAAGLNTFKVTLGTPPLLYSTGEVCFLKEFFLDDGFCYSAAALLPDFREPVLFDLSE